MSTKSGVQAAFRHAASSRRPSMRIGDGVRKQVYCSGCADNTGMAASRKKTQEFGM
jgi:hypothetical protein